MAFDIPNKIIFKRKEVIGLTKLDGRVLDYWETEFGGISPVVNSAGEKSYTRKDVEVILKIKQLLIVERVDKRKIKDIISGTTGDDRGEILKPARKKVVEERKTAIKIDLFKIKSELRDILKILEKKRDK